VFLTNSNSTDLDTSRAVEAAKKAQAASTAAALKAQAASSAAAKKAQQASSAAAESAWQTASVAAGSAASAAQSAARNAAVAASSAAQSASTAAQAAAKSAAANVNSQVRQGVFNARVWAAPKIEGAADYTTATIAPKVSEALRSTARQVTPEAEKSRRMSALTWTLLGAAIVAGLGAVAALVRYRYQSAAENGTADAGVAEDPLRAAQSASQQGGEPDSAAPGDQSADASAVNGRVSSTGW
jgi:hypothetical protein